MPTLIDVSTEEVRQNTVETIEIMVDQAWQAWSPEVNL